MVLVDANVLLDILTADPEWAAWSADKLERGLGQGLAINPVIYAELSQRSGIGGSAGSS